MIALCRLSRIAPALALAMALAICLAPGEGAAQTASDGAGPLLEVEKLTGEGVWVDPRIGENGGGSGRFGFVIWFEEQLLGDGEAYLRRAPHFEEFGRSELRRRAIRTLRATSDRSRQAAGEALDKLVADEVVSDLEFHWIVNSCSGTTNLAGIGALSRVPGVRKIFFAGRTRSAAVGRAGAIADAIEEIDAPDFDPDAYPAPWYVETLGVDRVWRELGVAGEGVLNVINDGNFALSDNVRATLYRNEAEPINGDDDDGNGLVDDRHGYDFSRGTANLTPQPVRAGSMSGQLLHGHQCAAIICGIGHGEIDAGAELSNQLGLAPESRWAGVIAGGSIEAGVEWAIEQGADTYSMSFSIPNLGEYRSHWRKMMEHGALCGVHFVSGAGNFAQQGSRQFAPVPVQMRTPEDIPQVVFAAAGVQRDLSRTPFSSQGPVEWNLEHYRDGMVDKPEVCAFNFQLPQLLPDGRVVDGRASGNSFAGPMFCGTIALMLSANPELHPWQVRQIIIDTARDVGPEGFDHQTGHGLIDAYAAVEQALAMSKEAPAPKDDGDR